MSGVKVDIVWSPNHQDKFITFGSDLRLYQVEEIKDDVQKLSAIPLSDRTFATLLSINSENQYMKCVSWYPKPNPDHLLAVGQANGRVVLTSFSQDFDSSNLIGKDFLPKHARQCNGIGWNPNEANLLAAGLDKYRTEHGILVWDVMKPSLTGHNEINTIVDKRQVSTGISDSSVTIHSSKPIVELGLSEATHSLHWFNSQSKIIVGGMNNKHIKIFDLRDPSKHQNVTSTKAVYGICVDPYSDHRLASFIENVILIWDVRNFEKPVATHLEAKHIAKLAWCPTRLNLLASLAKESSSIKLYDIQQASLGTDEMEPTVVERCVQPYNQHILSSFSWHLSQENRMLTITHSNLIRDYTVFDRITLNWSPTSEIVWSHGKKVLHCLDYKDKFYECLDDISVKMRRRALRGYGVKMHHLWQNGEAAEDNELQELWSWLDLVKSLQEEEEIKFKSSVAKLNPKFYGVHALICGDSNNTISRSEQNVLSWFGVENMPGCPNIPFSILKYSSKERSLALQLCSWGSENDSNTLNTLLDRLEAEGNFSRASAVAVFNLDIRKAIKILKKGAASQQSQGGDSNLTMVAMALSGYREEKNTLWREMCSTLRPQLQDPYLRAMFGFLTTDSDDYEEVVNEEGVSVQDRVAFACTFLPDKKLAEFLDKMKDKMVDMGSLEGFLLTGLSSDGMQLLQHYIDITGDVQTASLIALHTISSPVSQDSIVHSWAKCYSELLDSWRLWHQRAQFDVHWYKVCQSDRPAQQVFVSCNFCGKSVSSYLQYMGPSQGSRPFPRLSINAANRSKITCCLGCRKPIPRCALCLTHMGTPAGSRWKRFSDNKAEIKDQKLTPFSSWLSWCQSCRHGGHAAHLIDWFKEHSECPVTGCNCKCMSLDAVSKVSTVME